MDLGKSVFDTVFSFYDEFEKKGIEPQISFCEEPLLIIGNPEAIGRILQNIIKNALEHGEREIGLKLYQRDTSVLFCCENDVAKPDAIDVGQIFSRFYKADSARGSASTGLGLSIAKGLAEKMGGAISASLEGTVFRIEIQFEKVRKGNVEDENE